MPDMQQWSREVERIVDDVNRNAPMTGTLRTRILELMQQAYAAGLDDNEDVWQKRRMVAGLVPHCNTQGGFPGQEEVDRAVLLTEFILANVK